MSVNASQLELNQLIYRYLKEHGFLSAAEELQRLSPQEETNRSMSLLDIYKSWLKDPKKKHPNSKKCSKPGKGNTSSKAKSVKPRKKTDTSASPKKSLAKRKKNDEEPSKSVVKAKKSRPNATEKAAAAGDESDSDSSLDIEKWKKLLEQLTEADVAKMETINALTTSEPQPKKKRVRKPRAKPLPKADTPVKQNGNTTGQKVKEKAKRATQTPTKKIIPKRSRKDSSVLSPDKKGKGVGDTQALSTPAEKHGKQTQLQEMLVPVTAEDETANETAPKPKKKKKHKDKTEGKATETNDGEDKRLSNGSEIIEQEEAGNKKETKRSTTDINGNEEKVSELGFKKKKEKQKIRSEKVSDAEITKKIKKKKVVNEENSKELAEEINQDTNADKVGSHNKSKSNVEDKKAKKKKGKPCTEANLENLTVGNKETVEQNVEENEISEQISKKKKVKEKKETNGNVEGLVQAHEKKEKKKKKMLSNEGNLEHVDVNTTADAEQIVTITNVGGDEKNDQGKKAKKRKEKNDMDEILQQLIMEEDENTKQNVEDGENLELSHLKKKAKKKNRQSDKEDLEQTAEEDKPKEEADQTNSKSTMEKSECNLETTSPQKKKKKRKNKLKSDDLPEEADISKHDVSTVETRPAEVHKAKKKSKCTES